MLPLDATTYRGHGAVIKLEILEMKKTTYLAASTAGLLLGLSFLPVANAQSVDSIMLPSVGEFEVGNNETYSITNHRTDKEYRICVKKARFSVPLKVLFDGKEEIIAVGNCADFEAKNIRVTPAAKLADEAVIIGKFRRLRTE